MTFSNTFIKTRQNKTWKNGAFRSCSGQLVGRQLVNSFTLPLAITFDETWKSG